MIVYLLVMSINKTINVLHTSREWIPRYFKGQSESKIVITDHKFSHETIWVQASVFRKTLFNTVLIVIKLWFDNLARSNSEIQNIFMVFWIDYLDKAFCKIKPVSCIIRIPDLNLDGFCPPLIRKFVYFVQLTDFRGLAARRNLILEEKMIDKLWNRFLSKRITIG